MKISIEELLVWFKRYERYIEGDPIDSVEWRTDFLDFVMYLINNLDSQTNTEKEGVREIVNTWGAIPSTDDYAQGWNDARKEFAKSLSELDS